MCIIFDSCPPPGLVEGEELKHSTNLCPPDGDSWKVNTPAE